MEVFKVEVNLSIGASPGKQHVFNRNRSLFLTSASSSLRRDARVYVLTALARFFNLVSIDNQDVKNEDANQAHISW